MKINKSNQPNQPQPSSKKSIFKKIVFSVVIGLVFIIGIAMIFNKPIMEAYIKHHTDPRSVLKTSAATMSKNAKKKGNYNPSSAVPVSPENLVKAAVAGQSKPVVGLVSMPALNINLPILLDDGDYTMMYGAGQLQPNQSMGKGNYVMASHDMWTNADYYSKTLLFSPLKQAQNGQDIYLTDKQHVYHYVTYDIERILPTQWNHAVDPIEGKNVVTLLTCDTNDHYRIMVRGDLKDTSNFNNSTAKPFNAKFNQYWR